jgi:hypothetical protein
MQALELVVCTATAAVILFRAPFSVPTRGALLAGYFLAFEYGVISRSYGLGVLALVVVLAALGRPRPSWGGALAASVLLAWTSLAGAMITVALAVAVALDGRRPGPAAGPGRRRFVLGALLAAVGAALTCLPPSDFHQFTPSLGNLASATSRPTRVLEAAGGIWRGLVPVPARLGAWNTQLLDRLPAGLWVEAGLSILLFLAVLVGLRPRLARLVWCLGAVGCELFFVLVVVPDQARYAGTAFLVFVAAVWLARAPVGRPEPTASPRPGRGWAPAILATVVAAQVLATLAIYPQATMEAFSPDRQLAAVARAHRLSDALVSDDDFVATGVGAYLDRGTYSAARRAWTRFLIHDDRQAARMRALRPTDAVCAAARLATGRRRAAGLITAHTVRGPGLQRLAVVRRVALYAVTPAASSACRPAI